MKEGFLVNKGEYAAIPYCNQYLIIHNGQQLEKVCRTEGSARKYIEEHKKSASKGKLPVD
jgi:hypothetical protein